MSAVVVLRLRGEVDIAVVDQLRADWYAVADQQAPDEIVVDLREVTFLDASGLGLLAGLRNRQGRHGGRVRLCHAPGHVLRLLALTRLLQGFSIVPPDPDAVPGRAAIDLREGHTPGRSRSAAHRPTEGRAAGV